MKIMINESTLSDRSKVYDLILFSFCQDEGEDRLRIPCESLSHAECVAVRLQNTFLQSNIPCEVKL